MPDFQVSFKRQFNHGDEVVEFGVSAPVHVEAGEDFRVVCNLRYNELTAYIDRTIKSYIEAHPAPIKKVTHSEKSNDDRIAYAVMPVDKITVKIENGIRYYKVWGGQFGKYGVPLYDEYIPDGWNIPDEGATFTKGKWTAKVEMKTDKLPKKVVSFDRVDK